MVRKQAAGKDLALYSMSGRPHPGLYANNQAGYQKPIAFPSAIFSLFPLKKKKKAGILFTLH